jgi:uncharacterized membrane protein
MPDGRHHDAEGRLRLVERVMTWDRFIHLAFDELALAGAASPQVHHRLLTALLDLRSVAPADRQRVLNEEIALLSKDDLESSPPVPTTTGPRSPTAGADDAQLASPSEHGSRTG